MEVGIHVQWYVYAQKARAATDDLLTNQASALVMSGSSIDGTTHSKTFVCLCEVVSVNVCVRWSHCRPLPICAQSKLDCTVSDNYLADVVILLHHFI